jgi:hypothetical protein
MAGVATLKHGVVTLAASGGSITCVLGPGEGNFNIPDLEAGMVEAVPFYSRGTFQELMEGQQKAIEFSIEVAQEGKLTDNATNKPVDAILKQGTFSGATTVDPGGVVWTVNGTFVITRSGVTSTVTINNARCKVGVGEGMPNKLSISGTAYGTGSTLPIVVT